MKSPREALQPEAAPPPPPHVAPKRRRPSLVSMVSGTLSFIIVATVVVGIGWSFAARKVAAPGPLASDKTVNITIHDDLEGTLEEQGVIESAPFMKGVILLEGKKGSAKAGEYLFKQNASLQEVIDTVVSGKQVLHAITVPEGLTSLQTVDRLREDDVLTGDIKDIPPEGSLMPDTYKFSRGTRRADLVKTMQAEAKRVIADVWSRRETDIPIRSPFEMVTLASIVEKETGKADERPRVAGVFINRLTKNIPLQSDPTIVYGIVGGKGTLGRGILKSEVEQKTPYNTYAISGLPPGPIANPGRAALEAVANPSKTKDLFFVADGTGGHAFAETLDQHRANVVRWRQIEKDAKDKLVPDADKPGILPGGPIKNQRGDSDPAPQVYGMIGGFSSVPAVETSKTVVDAKPHFAFESYPLPGSATPGAVAPTFADGPSEASLGLAAEPTDVADGGSFFGDDGGAGSMATFPVAPARQAEMKARAAAYGLPTGVSETAVASMEAAAPRTATNPLPSGKVAIYDASEGTSLDPLRDKSYDLSTPKSVPVLKSLPPIASLNGR